MKPRNAKMMLFAKVTRKDKWYVKRFTQSIMETISMIVLLVVFLTYAKKDTAQKVGTLQLVQRLMLIQTTQRNALVTTTARATKVVTAFVDLVELVTALYIREMPLG